MIEYKPKPSYQVEMTKKVEKPYIYIIMDVQFTRESSYLTIFTNQI